MNGHFKKLPTEEDKIFGTALNLEVLISKMVKYNGRASLMAFNSQRDFRSNVKQQLSLPSSLNKT
jgi:hypothetical protein